MTRKKKNTEENLENDELTIEEELEEDGVESFDDEEKPSTSLEKEIEESLAIKGLKYPSKQALRNLPQYKNMNEEEFLAAYSRLVLGIRYDREWEKRILLKIKEFDKDYDLSDLKINDKNNLRALASASLQLDDFDLALNHQKSKGISYSNIQLIEKIGERQSALRKDIAQLEDILKISRKVRKSEEESSVPVFIDELKKKAKTFYEQKMFYILCPKCNTLVATIWTLYPEAYNNFTFTCRNVTETGEPCNHKFEITSKTLFKNKGSNKRELLPESMR